MNENAFFPLNSE